MLTGWVAKLYEALLYVVGKKQLVSKTANPIDA